MTPLQAQIQALRAAPFIADTPELRDARKEAGRHRVAYENAKAAHERSSHHLKAWQVAKARVASLEVRNAH